MKKVLFSSFCLLLSLGGGISHVAAQTAIAPTTWSGSGASATGPSTFTALPASTTPGSTSVSVSQWNRGAGVVNVGTATAYVSKSWGTGTTLASAVSANTYVYFTITNNSSTELDVTKVVVLSTENASGPTNVQMQYTTGSSGNMNFGAMVTVTTGATTTLTFTPATPIYMCANQTDTFKLYGWGATAAAGALSVNNNSYVSANYANAISATAAVTSPTPTCVGSTLSFGGTVTGGVSASRGFGPPPYLTYAWSGPGYSSTRNPPSVIFGAGTSASGTYTFTATDSFGCSSTSTLAVTVSPSPSAPTITPSTATTICSNDSLTFTTATIAGYTYQWDTGRFGPPSAISGATNNTYYATRAGNYSVTVFNAAGCSASSSPSVPLTVLTAPTATATASGPLGFCSGGSVTFTSSIGAGNSYQWYNGSTAISGANTNTYTDAVSGDFYVKVTAANGCVVDSRDFVVTEVTTPTITAASAANFCQGGSVLLQTSITAGATGVSIQWIRNGTDTLVGATTTSFVANVTGDYTCYVSIAPACAITTNDIMVTVYPTPNPSISFNGATLATSDTFATYQWFLNTVVIPGATNYTAHTSSNGSYRVMVSDYQGCSNLSNEYVIYDLAVANVNTEAQVAVYPNPASGMLSVIAPADSKVVISAMDGRTVFTAPAGKNLDISLLNTGIYTVSVIDISGNRLHVEKLTKQ